MSHSLIGVLAVLSFLLARMVNLQQVAAGAKSIPCDAECRVSVRPSGSDAAYSSTNCSLERDTPTCSNLSLSYSFDRPCTTTELDMVVTSRYWHETSTNIESHVILNVSMVVHEPVATVFLELECISAPHKDDGYCHDKRRPLWSRYIWPCRAFQLQSLLDHDHDKMELRLPAKFSFNCFRIYGFSQYALNVSLVPQMCRSTFIVTIPMEDHVHPELEKYKSDAEKTDWSKWSPLVLVDTNSYDGVWVRFAAPPSEFFVKELSVDLYLEVPPKGTLQLVAPRHLVKLPNTGVKIENLDSGNYTVFVYIDRHDCILQCAKDDQCITCPHTALNFTLTKDRWTTPWRTWNVFINVIKYVGFAIIGILIITAAVIVALILYLRHRKNVIARTVQEVELTWRPKVLLIYSDDCAQHSLVVAELGRFLKAEANAEIFLDQWALDSFASSPNEWMLRSLETCDFYVVVLSAGTKKVFEGHLLLRRRHYPDLFHLGVTGVMQELLRECRLRAPHSTDVLRKYIWVRFDYSAADCVEPFLTRLPCTRLVLPSELLDLIGHLHSVNPRTVDQSTRPNTVELDAAIAAVREMQIADPNWLDERVSSSVDQVGLSRLTEIERNLDGLPFRPETAALVPMNDAFRAARETVSTANGRYSLMEPDDDQADLLIDAPQYELVGGPDQLSDSD